MYKFVFAALSLLACVSVQAAESFGFQQVVDQARALGAAAYREPEPIPRFMRELNYDQYQGIRFNPEKNLWLKDASKFQVMLMAPGLFYGHPVKINVIDGKGVSELAFRKDMFTFDDPEIEKLVPPDLGFAGLKLTYPFFDAKVPNQFLVFAGASYFRGVGKGNGWGISGRGIALDTGLPTGEEFPSFVEFWLHKPKATDQHMTVYGLLDGPSVAGAYQFTIKPGSVTAMDVKAVLFPREQVKLMGLAPLTSMFFYGENTARPRGEWRAQVHDSDGLLLHNGTGEWLWRPLLNPVHLQMDYFRADNLKGFGLLQRDTRFSEYHDLGARYEIRPSAWVKPENNWGPGNVVLVQLPTDMETNDNIVAFWSPLASPAVGQPYHIGYSVSFGPKQLAGQQNAQVINTFVGDGSIIGGGAKEGAYRLVVDFAGAALDTLAPEAPVEGVVTGLDGTEVLESYVEYMAPEKAWRLSILALPKAGKSLTVRAFLQEQERALSETWDYRLPPENDILKTQD